MTNFQSPISNVQVALNSPATRTRKQNPLPHCYPAVIF